MCDTLVALGPATADGSTLLAKNSDREPNEAQALTYVPHAVHAPGSKVRLTNIEIPQVRETYEAILSRPFWLWGAEMGANEHGVAIGNEAVFTREPYDKRPGMLGMDLLRLALERADNAQQALAVIVELLARYGQGGNCGFRTPTYYHNSFLIADPHEAWVLETAGAHWAAERVKDVRTISNGLTIGETYDLSSPGLVEHATARGYRRQGQTFHFARCFADPLYTALDGCRIRQARSTSLLKEAWKSAGGVTPAAMRAALRDHGTDPAWEPSHGWTMDTLCVHACCGPTRGTQSTGSLVAHLTPDLPTFWLTGTSAPCTGLFKPVFLGGAGLPDLGPVPDGAVDGGSLWWRHERLHRAVLRDYRRLALYRAERDALEAAFAAEAAAACERCRSLGAAERAGELRALTASALARSAEAEAGWLERVTRPGRERPQPLAYRLSWRGYDRAAGLRR